VTALKHIINWIVWTLLGLYALVMLAVQTPLVQEELGRRVSSALGDKLGTKVAIGRVDLGFLNRLILDDVLIYDLERKELLKAARVTAKIDMAPLALGRIVVSSAQIFSAHLQLSRPSASRPTNFQFILDALASDDTTSHTPLNLRINSFIMRRSSVSYDQWDVAPTPSKFNPSHLRFSNISAYITLKALTDDSINVNVKRLTFLEQSGADVRRLAFKLAAGHSSGTLSEFQLQMPSSSIGIDNLSAHYDDSHLIETLQFQGALTDSKLSPSDLAFLLPMLGDYRRSLNLSGQVKYASNTLEIPRFTLASTEGSLGVRANGRLYLPKEGRPSWTLNVDQLKVDNATLAFVSDHVTPLPAPVMHLDDIMLKGAFSSDLYGTLHALADVNTNVGHVDALFQMTANKEFEGHINTDGIDLQRLLDSSHLGLLATSMDVNGTAGRRTAAKGHVERLDFDGETYSGIDLNATYETDRLTAWLQVADPKIMAELEADVRATSLNDALGIVSVRNISLPAKDFHADYVRLESTMDDGRRAVTLNSDFAHAELVGNFDYTTLAQSLANAVGSRLTKLPGLPPVTRSTSNNFRFHAMLADTDWLQKLLNVNLDIHQPTTLSMTVNDQTRQLMVDLQAPSFTYDDSRYKNVSVHITSPNDTMFVKATASTVDDDNEAQTVDFNIDGSAANDNLSLALNWQNNGAQRAVNGRINAEAQVYKNFDNRPELHVRIMPSVVRIDNSHWQIEPSDILYNTDRLLVDHFSAHNGLQNFSIDGMASKRSTDSLTVDLHDVEVAYILDLVNFDAVSFSGRASGKACLTSAFDTPDASARLRVDDFKFQDGRMGVLAAQVDWNKEQQQIDIHATANDGLDAMTYISGYVSPAREYIDLGFSARGTYLDFVHSWCDSFISNITGHGTGDVRLAGPLSAINLTGSLIVDAEATITPLNTTYELRRDTLSLIYNEIMLNHQPLYDKYGNVAYVDAGIHHEDLTNLSLDLHVNTDKLLGYDFKDFDDQSFYGTVYAAGDVDIRMKGDDVNIDCNVTPLKNSVFVYNAANPETISSQEFITWKNAPATSAKSGVDASATAGADAPSSEGASGGGSNIYMNFTVNATPEGTMRILMDAKTNDYITLNGNGVIKASYYNKGAFQMFGTYTVESGTYDVTIQNIINKKFQFQPGGTLTFGGDPYLAALNLQAMYTVNGVSLSDLNIGNTFSSNTVRVNCLMNIGGQPASPEVTFDLDMPNVNADEKQMVRSLLSSQQEMNQQVLYLLGIGRFYSQGQNNANQQQQAGQTSLAMQSFLSGTLSTQINNVIGQFVKNDDWNFGANISTGTEGWNNAEYEGIINGRMLNNRLLINGQFGYRDNATQANPSFIGDFDVRYLLLPSGNLALKVYNQTNDRYFTRSSLNTQGIGLIMKRDFNGLNDFFGIKPQK